MTWDEFGGILKPLKIPAAYGVFKHPTKPPFLVYGTEGESDFMADDQHYIPIVDGYLELYCDKKEPLLEQRIKNTLTANQIVYHFSNETFIQSEKIYLVRWAVTFLGG